MRAGGGLCHGAWKNALRPYAEGREWGGFYGKRGSGVTLFQIGHGFLNAVVDGAAQTLGRGGEAVALSDQSLDHGLVEEQIINGFLK